MLIYKNNIRKIRIINNDNYMYASIYKILGYYNLFNGELK